jgi:hypothetical protein
MAMARSQSASRGSGAAGSAFGTMVAALALLVAGVAGCSSGSKTAAPTAAATPFPASSPSAVDDPPGAITCSKLVKAVNDATLMEPGVVDDIVAASSTADAPVADSARRLAAAYASAVTAKGSDSEPDAVAAVSTAGADMSKVCADSGLETVG